MTIDRHERRAHLHGVRMLAEIAESALDKAVSAARQAGDEALMELLRGVSKEVWDIRQDVADRLSKAGSER